MAGSTTAILAISVQEVVANHRVNGHPSKELTTCLSHPEQQNGRRNTNSAVNAILNGGENRHDHTNKEDNGIQGGDSPELVNRVGRGDQITNTVNDNTGKGRFRDVKENSCECVDGDEDEDCCNATSERSSHTSFGLDGGSRKRSGSGIATQERTQQVGDTNGNHFLRGIDSVVVDTTEGLGNGNVLDQENDNSSRKLAGESFDYCGIDPRDSSILESYTGQPLSDMTNMMNEYEPRGTSPITLNNGLSLRCKFVAALIIV